MKKFNKIIYNKLLLQAQEAKYQGLNTLASGIFNAIGAYPEEENIKYSYEELNEDVYKGLWKIAGNVIQYYDINRVDAEKVNNLIESFASQFIEELEGNIDIKSNIGPLEPKVPGEVE